VIAALLAVLVLGVLHGLLTAIGVSLLLTLRKLSEPAVSVLGRLRQTRDFVDVSAHADAAPIPGITIVRPEVPLFFANAERVLSKVRGMLRGQPTPAHTVMLSLEETPDVKRHKVVRESDLKSSHRQIRERVILKNRYLSTRCRIIDVKSSHLAGRPMPSMARF
jgi:MFS superfamily sulfate permease-like transporter